MSKNIISGLSLEKIKQSEKEQKNLRNWWKNKYSLINWTIVCIFAISFLIVLAVSIFPIFSVKYRIAESSFDNNLENKIVADYYKDIENEKSDASGSSFKRGQKVADLNEFIKEETKDLAGNYGVYVKDLTSKETFSLNEEKVFTAASLSKLFVVGKFYNEIWSDSELELDKLVLKKEDRVSGGGSVGSSPIGSEYDAKGLIEQMLKNSDNTAMAILSRELGIENIENFIEDLGLKNTSFYDNTTSPKDVGVFLEKLNSDDFLDSDSAKEMIGFMQNTSFEDRLPFYLPKDIRIAHKIGTWEGAYSDAGIVFGNKNKYIIVVMTDGANYEEAVNAIRIISEATYNYLDE